MTKTKIFTSLIIATTLILPLSSNASAEKITQDSLKTYIESKGDLVKMSNNSELEIPATSTGEISTMGKKPLGLGEVFVYVLDGGGQLYWEGAHAVVPLPKIRALTESVSGILYKKYKDTTKWITADSDSDVGVNTLDGVFVETGEDKSAKGSVGTTIRAETVGSLTTIAGNATDTITIDYVIK